MTTTVTERNTYIDVQDENGNIERHYPITKYENVMNVPDASEETAGVTKLYNDKGDNEDGSMTQKVITEKYSEFKYLTQAEYDVLPDTKLTDEIIYVITDGADTNGAIVYLTQAQYDLLPDTKLIDGLLYAITDAGTFGGNGGGGGNTTMIYLTQAQYDALPDTKLTDNLVYMITDAGTDLYGELATVSKTGSYNDLLDKPVIPDKSTIDSHISNSNIHVTTQDKAAWNGSYENSTAYTDLKINELVNGAPETLDTIKEVADAIEENETVMEALDSAIGTKANQSELDTHTSNTTSHITASERTAWNAKQNALTIDSNLSTTSTNPVQNKAVKSAIDNHTGDTAKHISATERTAWNKNTTDISKLNTDLTNRPSLLEKTGNSTLTTLKGKAKLFATNGIVPSGGYEVASCGKNLLNFTLDELKALNTKGVWSNNVYTIYGVTLTVNNDMTITINGTPTNAIEFKMGYFTPIVGQSYTFSVGDYKTSGYSRCYLVGVNGTSGWYDVGTFTTTTSNRISCILKVETSFSNKVLSAMLRYSFITDNTYERYVGENRATISNSDGVYLDTYDGVTYIVAPNEVTTIYGGNVQGNELLKNDSALNENLTNTSLYLPTKEITSGNLNNYTESGIWYISSTNAPNILNVPVTSTMKLTVEKMEKSYSIQVVKNLSYTIYRRYQYWNTSTSSITWSSWKHIDFI